MIMMNDRIEGSMMDAAETINALRRSNADFRKRIESMEMDRVRFVDHIADLAIRHGREVDQLAAQIRDLHRLVARSEIP